MKGTLHKTDSGWQVSHATYNEITKRWIAGKLPLHPDDVKQILEDSQRFDNIEARIAAYPDVEFDWCVIVDHDTGKGIEYAKLKQTKEYPELEGTMALCEDMIEAAKQQSVPAPDELQQELRRVRVSKTAHVKAQRYTLAAIYREAEKEIESIILNQKP